MEDKLKEKDNAIEYLVKAVKTISDSLETKCDKFDHDVQKKLKESKNVFSCDQCEF